MVIDLIQDITNTCFKVANHVFVLRSFSLDLDDETLEFSKYAD